MLTMAQLFCGSSLNYRMLASLAAGMIALLSVQPASATSVRCLTVLDVNHQQMNETARSLVVEDGNRPLNTLVNVMYGYLDEEANSLETALVNGLTIVPYYPPNTSFFPRVSQIYLKIDIDRRHYQNETQRPYANRPVVVEMVVEQSPEKSTVLKSNAGFPTVTKSESTSTLGAGPSGGPAYTHSDGAYRYVEIEFTANNETFRVRLYDPAKNSGRPFAVEVWARTGPYMLSRILSRTHNFGILTGK